MSGTGVHPKHCTKVLAMPMKVHPTVNQSCVSAQKMNRLENHSHNLIC